MQNAVILYYKYVALPDPQGERDAQRALCELLGLKGRVLIASEGINGTLSGTSNAVDAYIAAMDAHPHFAGIEYKRDASAEVPFPKLKVKVRPEIVTLGAEIDPAGGATKLTPAEFHELIQNPDVVLFDARNDYESAIGKFRGAVTPGIKLFKDLPAALDEYEDLKDKTVVTYCTGGIRCEKASALMKSRGFKKLYQLEGGIIQYAKAYPEGAFEGECFVFDDRMSVAFNDHPQALGTCHFCSAGTNDYYNCQNPTCNDLILVCVDCHEAGRTRCEACAARPGHVNTDGAASILPASNSAPSCI